MNTYTITTMPAVVRRGAMMEILRKVKAESLEAVEIEPGEAVHIGDLGGENGLRMAYRIPARY